MKSSTFFFLAFAPLLMTPAFAQDERPYPQGGSTYNETRISTLENSMRDLNGRIEQLDYQIRSLSQSMQRLQTDLDARMAKVEAGQAALASQAAAAVVAPPQPQIIPQPQVAPAQAQPPVEPNGTLGALKLQNGKVTGGVNNPQSPALPNVPADYGLTPAEQYERAFNFLREADYANAEESFKGFIEKNPKDKLIDNAKYWYGETLYVRARYDEAAVAFADAYQQNPQGQKAPDSLLKLGMSLGALNKTQDACVTLNELRVKYPNASPTTKSRADEQRAKLKCPSR